MPEFTLKLKTLEAVNENTKTLLEHYKKCEISKSEFLEFQQIALEEEQYEVLISVKEVLDYIATEKKIKNKK